MVFLQKFQIKFYANVQLKTYETLRIKTESSYTKFPHYIHFIGSFACIARLILLHIFSISALKGKRVEKTRKGDKDLSLPYST